MVGSRTVTALAGLAASLLISAAAWVYLDTLLVFLFVPLVPLLLRGRGLGEGPEPGGGREHRRSRRCPACGFETRDPDHDYCPRDGTRLEQQE